MHGDDAARTAAARVNRALDDHDLEARTAVIADDVVLTLRSPSGRGIRVRGGESALAAIDAVLAGDGWVRHAGSVATSAVAGGAVACDSYVLYLRLDSHEAGARGYGLHRDTFVVDGERWRPIDSDVTVFGLDVTAAAGTDVDDPLPMRAPDNAPPGTTSVGLLLSRLAHHRWIVDLRLHDEIAGVYHPCGDHHRAGRHQLRDEGGQRRVLRTHLGGSRGAGPPAPPRR